MSEFDDAYAAIRANHLLMIERTEEAARLRALLGELWADGSVRAAVGDGSSLVRACDSGTS